MDHLGTGKPWDLNRKNNGLFILPPYVTRDNAGAVSGVVDILRNLSDYLRKSRQKYVILTDSNIICSVDFEHALAFHREKDADITVVYARRRAGGHDTPSKSVLLGVEEDGSVDDIEAYPRKGKNKNVSLNMYVMEKTLLQNLVEDCVAHGKHDFVIDVLLGNLGSLSVYGYQHEGYTKKIDDIQSYYAFNMDLLSPEIRGELFGTENKVYTKVKDEVPTKYNDGAVVRNSMIADGCVIDGTVENSVLFRGVHIKGAAVIKNSIIMQGSEVYEDCVLENVILDKEVTVKSGRTLIGQSKYPIVIGKGAVV
jgi:glucose-1-phosphate adenylyltransferase